MPTMDGMQYLGRTACKAVQRWSCAIRKTAAVSSHLQPDAQEHVQDYPVDSQASPLSPLSQPWSSSLPDSLQTRRMHLSTTKGLEMCPCRRMAACRFIW